MPSVSKAQRRTMAAAAHNPSFARKMGIPPAVAKDFNEADTGKPAPAVERKSKAERRYGKKT